MEQVRQDHERTGNQTRETLASRTGDHEILSEEDHLDPLPKGDSLTGSLTGHQRDRGDLQDGEAVTPVEVLLRLQRISQQQFH
jgi:hypothetical protein